MVSITPALSLFRATCRRAYRLHVARFIFRFVSDSGDGRRRDFRDGCRSLACSAAFSFSRAARVSAQIYLLHCTRAAPRFSSLRHLQHFSSRLRRSRGISAALQRAARNIALFAAGLTHRREMNARIFVRAVSRV